MKPVFTAPQPVARQVAPVLLMVLLGARTAFALPDDGRNCRGCHGTVRSGMTLTSFQSTTNLGGGLLKVFQVRPGQTVPIRLSVTNSYNNSYGVSLDSLSSSGVQNPTHKMTFTADQAWTDQGGWFTQGPTMAAPQVWTFNLAIATNTPPDFYPVGTQMAGVSSGRWSQVETFYVQVVANTAPRPVLISAARAGATFSVQVPTVSGFTYYLEYKTDAASAAWTAASQTPGDGTTRTLSDTAANEPQRFYRVRLQ